MEAIYLNNDSNPPGTLHLAGISLDRQNPPILGMRTLDRFALTYLYGGEGLLEQSGQPVERMRPGSCLLIRPGVPHQYRPASEMETAWREIYFVFGGPVFDAWANAPCLPKAMHFELKPVEYWLAAFQKAFPEVHERNDPLQTNLDSICRIQELLAEIALFVSKGDLRQQQRQWVDRARDVLNRLHNHQWKLPLAAKTMDMPYDAFRKRFTKLAGMTPSQHVAIFRSELACRMLLESNLTLTEIADRLGYCDAFHFSKAFKKAVGNSPSAYRKNHT